MRLFLSICSLFVFFCITSNAQEYIQVKQSCAMCYGYGKITTMYGPAYCPNCHGSGAVIVTVPNPDYKPVSNGPSFKNKQPYAAEWNLFRPIRTVIGTRSNMLSWAPPSRKNAPNSLSCGSFSGVAGILTKDGAQAISSWVCCLLSLLTACLTSFLEL